MKWSDERKPILMLVSVVARQDFGSRRKWKQDFQSYIKNTADRLVEIDIEIESQR
jgi:hypothetical protein